MSQQIDRTGKLSLFISLVKQSIRGDQHDYTEGSIRQAIVLLAIPMILELSLESVFAVVDMFFVGRLGRDAIATVGLTEASITIVYSIGFGLSTGAAAVVARRIGEKNAAEAAHSGVQCLLIALVLSLIISVCGIVFAPNILQLMGATGEVVKQGAIFTRIMLGGSAAIMFLFLINGIFRGAGDAAIAMRSLWIASGLNIILCPLLIYGIGHWDGLGLKGAAIATTIGRGAGVLYQCYKLFGGKSVLKVRWIHFKWDTRLIKTIIGVAWPATIQFIIQSGSWIILTRIIATTGGTDASAGYQVAIRNVVFFILPAWGLSNAAATLVGQNLGAKRAERAEKSVLLTAKYNAIFMAIVTVVFLLCSFPIIRVFTDEPSVQLYGIRALQIIGAGFIFYGVGMVMIQALNGAGDTKTPTWLNFIGFWLFQVPLAYFMAKVLGWGPTGAFVAIPVAETAIAIAAWIYFKKGRWKKVVI